MSSGFEAEKAQLVAWIKGELARVDKEFVPHRGLDDRLWYLRRPYIDEYNRRLSELKEKYSIE